jgi:hypothetical protein
MHIKRALAVVAAGAVMVLGAGTAQAGPRPPLTGTVKQVLGRQVATYTSTPTDPTPVSKWVASAQGETVDVDNDGVADGLRGRAAVQESFGVRRARIYATKTRIDARIGGVWRTVDTSRADVVNEAPRAYAVAYTFGQYFCAGNPDRTYRVVDSHAVRRDDGVVAYRTTVSTAFVAPMLLSDPECKWAELSATVWGPTELARGEKATYTATFEARGYADGTMENTAKRVNPSDDLIIDRIDSPYYHPDDTTPDPNDWVDDNATWDYVNGSEDIGIEVIGGTAGPQTIEGSYTSTSPWARAGSDTLAVEVLPREGTFVDLEVIKNLHWEEADDVDPSTGDLDLHPGDPVTYRFDLRNDGPDTARSAYVWDAWPAALEETIEHAWYESSGEPVPCHVNSDGHLVCNLGDIASGAARVLYVQGRVKADAPAGPVTNWGFIDNPDRDIDAADNFADGATFTVVPTP